MNFLNKLHLPVTCVRPGRPNAVTSLSVVVPSQTPLPFMSRYEVPDAGHGLDSRRSKLLIAGIPYPVSFGIKPPSRVDNRDSGQYHS